MVIKFWNKLCVCVRVCVCGLGNILVPVVIFSFNVVLLNEPGIHVSAKHFLFSVKQNSRLTCQYFS